MSGKEWNDTLLMIITGKRFVIQIVPSYKDGMYTVLLQVDQEGYHFDIHGSEIDAESYASSLAGSLRIFS